MYKTTTTFTALSLLALLIASPAHANQKSMCQTPTEHDIAKLFDRWNDSLKTGDAMAVAANYAADAVLLPTLSNTPRRDDKARVDYFEYFLQKQPAGKIDSRTIKTGCNEAFDTGIYTFTFGDTSAVQARYTFTYGWVDGKWLITSHHSSAMPEAIASTQ